MRITIMFYRDRMKQLSKKYLVYKNHLSLGNKYVEKADSTVKLF